MADRIRTKEDGVEGTPRELHPPGSFLAQCVDVVNLGKKHETYEGKDNGLVPKLALVFRTGETTSEGELMELSAEMTIASGAKAKLRQFAEAWRGKKYDEEYPDIHVHKFEGLWATITVVHKTSGKGNQYAAITGLTAVPKGMTPNADYLSSYTRAEFWDKRKDEYKQEADKYLAQQGKPSAPAKSKAGPPAPDFDEPLPEYEGDDELPF